MLAVAVASAAVAQPASAAVAGATKSIVVTANTSDVLLAGFANGAAVTVVRDGVTMATAKNVNVPGTAPAEGGINSAHLAGAGGCWTDFTPQLLPGDTVKAGTDSTVLQGVTADPLVVSGGELIVHGTAVDANGNRLPAGEIDAQLESPSGRFSQGSSGGQFLSAQSGDLGGVIGYDSRTSSNWTARWPMPASVTDQAFAQASTVIGAWTGPAGAPPTAGGEQTHFAVDEPAGPTAACAKATYAPDQPTGADHNPVNAAALGTGLVVKGTAQPGVSAVAVTLTDAAGKALTRGATLAGRDWTASFPGADVAGLADGALTVSGAYKLAAGTIHGATTSIGKDTAAPAAPTASVPAGVYAKPQSVTLAAEDGATIHYTVDGSEPSAASAAASGPLAVGGIQTIKAVAIDPAGNTSPAAAFAYVIGPDLAPDRTSTRLVLRLEALRVSPRLRLRAAHRRGVRVLLTAPRGAKFVKVRLMRGRRTVAQVVRRVRGNRLMTVVLPRKRSRRRALHAGTYRVVVQPGTSPTDLGAATTRTVRIR